MHFNKVKVTDFGGINNGAPVIIDLGSKAWVTAGGDNGAGKTSLLKAILVSVGALSKDNKAFINNDSDNLEIDTNFVGNDRLTYDVRVTKSQFKLMYEGENLPEPISKLKELIGVVGVSPMEIKEKPLKDQIKWIASYSNIDEALFEKKMNKIKNDLKVAREARASANKSFKGLTEILNDNPLFTNWEKSEKKYAKKIDITKLSKELTDAGLASDKYLQAETKLKGLKESKPKLEQRIEDLKAQLLAAETELTQLDTSIANGNKYLDENKNAKKNYDEVKARYDASASEAVQYDRWQDVLRKKKEMDEYETLSQRADATEKKLLQEQKELQWEILPDIKNVEFVLEDYHEDGKIVKEGMYWDGKSTAQMSETEWWDIVMKIWEKFKVKLIVIDNFQSLGSMAVKTLERLHKAGATIFAGEMKRGVKELVIETK